MTDPGQDGNKTVFRPSPLQALKNAGQPVAPPPPAAPPPPPLPMESVARKVRTAKPAARGSGRTALIVLFVVVTLLALGYVAVQVTTGAAPSFRLGAAVVPKATT